MTYILNWKSSD